MARPNRLDEQGDPAARKFDGAQLSITRLTDELGTSMLHAMKRNFVVKMKDVNQFFAMLRDYVLREAFF